MSYSGGTGPIPTPLVAPVAGTKILLRRTSTADKKPEAGTAEYGELFINYHSTSPMLCFKDNAANIVEIRPLTEVELALGELTDVDTTGATTGMVLSYNGSTWVPVSAASIAIDVDLGYTPAADKGTVTNTAGDDATIPLATGTNAGLSLNNYTTTEKDKLAAVIPGANVNVNADWNASSGDAEILNKPDIPDELGDLSDVDTSGATSGQLLRYDGAEWKPGSPAAVNVDLGYTPAADKGTVTNDSGDDATLPLVDGSNAGLMAPGDYTKLSGIQAGAEVNVDPTISYNVLNDGKDGTLVVSPGGDTAIIDNATVSKAGLMTKGDKSKLDGYPATPGEISGTQDLQSVTDNGNTTTNGATFSDGKFVITGSTGVLTTYGNIGLFDSSDTRTARLQASNGTLDLNGGIVTRGYFSTGICINAVPSIEGDPQSHTGINIRPSVGTLNTADSAYTGLTIGLNNTSPNLVRTTGTWIRPDLTDKATDNYGFFAQLEKGTKNNFNFFADQDAPNFFAGSTYIGGNTTRNTRELWESLLTEEQKEQLAAGTLAIPANVSTPGDGSFVRQWWYDQQRAEDQALIDSGELEYPEHLQAANFTDTFALGDNTLISLSGSNGEGKFRALDITTSTGLKFSTANNFNNYSKIYQNSSGDNDYGLQLFHYGAKNDDPTDFWRDAGVTLGGQNDGHTGRIRFYTSRDPGAEEWSYNGAWESDGSLTVGGTATGNNPTIKLSTDGKASFKGGVNGFATTMPDNTGVDITTANFWEVADGITIANPTSALAGQSGIFIMFGAPLAWGDAFEFPGGTPPALTSFPAILPYYVRRADQIFVGSPVEGMA